MGKKNILPNLNQPVIRTHVAKPALEGLTEENLTIVTWAEEARGASPTVIFRCDVTCRCSYDGDDAE